MTLLTDLDKSVRQKREIIYNKWSGNIPNRNLYKPKMDFDKEVYKRGLDAMEKQIKEKRGD